MKIYILRHEERPSDCSFFTPLTKQGLINAKQLVLDINKQNINIDLILSSPFIRTLQTIYPYATNKKLKINLEYGLSEIHHPECITQKAVGMQIPEYIEVSFDYNDKYESIINQLKIVLQNPDLKLRQTSLQTTCAIIQSIGEVDKQMLFCELLNYFPSVLFYFFIFIIISDYNRFIKF